MTKDGSWFEDPVICDGKEVTTECIENYNKVMLDPIQNITWFFMRFTVLIGAIGCIACFKWRYIAEHFFTLLHIQHFVISFHLNKRNYNNRTYAEEATYIATVIFLLSIGYRREIIIGCINMTIHNVFGRRIAYLKPITDHDIMLTITFAVSFCIAATVLNMTLIKIGEFTRRLREMTS